MRQAKQQNDDILDGCSKYRDRMSAQANAVNYISLGVACEVLWEQLPKVRSSCFRSACTNRTWTLDILLPFFSHTQHQDADKDAQLQQLLHWHQANTEFATASCLKVDFLNLALPGLEPPSDGL